MAVKKRFVMLFFVTAAVSLVWGANEVRAQAEKSPVVRNMNITGQIGKVEHGYVIRGTSKSVIFTVLNPAPEILDGLVKNGKDVNVDVHIVSGDNVNIEKINGKPYTSKKGGAVRNMSLTGVIGKVKNGYVIRGTSKSVIFTVLNPAPEILDSYAKSGEELEIDVRIVSGDNVNIETIDGKPYPRKDPSVREMTLKGEIVKVPTGYVVRGTDKSVIFTVLNPQPAALDKLVEAGKEVEVKVGIVSGDNVNIEKINGEAYPPAKAGK